MDVRMSLQNPAFNIFVSTSGNEIAGPYGYPECCGLHRKRLSDCGCILLLVPCNTHHCLTTSSGVLKSVCFRKKLHGTYLLLTGQKTTVRILLPALCSHSYPTLELGKSPLNGSMDLLRPKKDQSTWEGLGSILGSKHLRGIQRLRKEMASLNYSVIGGVQRQTVYYLKDRAPRYLLVYITNCIDWTLHHY
ncbi:uncharacterized protein [Saccopteryx leptura]|uniref:uncharacterized protein isoform X2 n=1 Tax=Saccopteryx leptura TaxID=249018 RepID=UPI00339BBF18